MQELIGEKSFPHSVGREILQAFIFLSTQQVKELDQIRKDILNT